MKTSGNLIGKAAPLLGAAAGAAVCLNSVPPATAAVVTGTIAGSNGGTSSFGGGDTINVFSTKAEWFIATVGQMFFQYTAGNKGYVNNNGTNIVAVTQSASVTVSAGLPGSFNSQWVMPASVTDKYLAARFEDGGTRFGWIHVVTANTTNATIDLWGYENSGASIKTASDTVAAKKLPLSDGRTKLTWTNANEEGVSRYEVQAKGADGAWSAVDSETPGEGAYAATLPGDREYKLVVELTSGKTSEVDF